MTNQGTRVPRLSRRLRMIADLIPPCERIIDIGCDYAYLPAVLLWEGKVNKAILTDINEKPLRRAEELMKELGLTDQCEFHCCDGFGPVYPKDGDRVVVAGMGGREICSILAQRELPESSGLVLQANWNREYLRSFLARRGYRIEEYALEEKGYWYSIWSACEKREARELNLEQRSIGEFWLSDARFTADQALGWLRYNLRLYRDKSKKYPEYLQVCELLEELCCSMDHAL